jgi:hypothetical protein
MVEPTGTCEQLNKWKQGNLPILRTFARENQKLHAISNSKDWKLGINYKHTAHTILQQNHLAELGFSVLAYQMTGLLCMV